MLLVKNLILPNARKVDLEISEDKAYVLKGPNGTGKTLLLRSLAALYPLKYETFLYQERSISDWKIEAYRSEVLYIPSVPNMNGITSIEEFLERPFTFKINKSLKPQLDLQPLLIKWGLSGQSLGQLSSGQKQILSFVRALTLKPRLLLLDEPTSHLDPAMTLELENLLLDWKKKTKGSFILITHNQVQIERLKPEIISFQ